MKACAQKGIAMKNQLRRLWQFANQEVFTIDADTVKSGVSAAQAVFKLAATVKKEEKNSQEIADLFSKTSTLLDILNSPWAQVINSSLPFVSIATGLLIFYLEKTKKEPTISQCVALVTQAAYLQSLQDFINHQEHKDLLTQLQTSKNEASELLAQEINRLGDLELGDYAARFALVYFPESELANAFNDVVIERLKEADIEQQYAKTIVKQIASSTPRYIDRALAETSESTKRLKDWYLLGGNEIFERYASIDTYLEGQIATLPTQNVFDEEFTFADIYVPLKAIPLDANGKEIEYVESFVLQDWVKEGLLTNGDTNRDKKDKHKVIVIQAGPGRGKSVFCRMFADQVRRELHPTLTPIFIRLRDIDSFEQNFEQTLTNAIKADFVKTDDGWLYDRNTHYLFFLDGFDELRLEGRAKVGVERFLQQVATFQEKMQTSETGHRVILTGRTIAFQGINLPPNLTQVKMIMIYNKNGCKNGNK